MPNLLTDESPQIYHPTLATWVGLNEAIFLAQLHYILTKNDKVGKFADGRKWYRDKPHDFVVKYFPFWDEGIVKRVIDNLRNDGLIMARSDLNKDPKDRSLWYTVYYEAIDRLTGPVDRLTQKASKRKEARKVRSEKAKVQNVLMDISTKCTEAEVQNVLPTLPTTEVQNVPTPKDSLTKELQPKDKIPPKGDGKPSSSLPKRVRKPRSFREDSPKAALSRQMFSALADLIKYDLDMLGEKQRGQLNQAEKRMREKGYMPTDIDAFREWWYANDWRGKKNQPPGLEDMRQTWKQFLDWRKEQAERANGWNVPPDPIPPPAQPEYITVWESAKPMVRGQMTGATFDNLFQDAQPVERENGTFELRVKASTLEMIAARPRVKANILTALQAVKPEIHDLDFKELKL